MRYSLESWSSYDAALAASLQALRSDELIVFPTDTLYGLGAHALHEKAVGKIIAAKGRDKPISIIVSGLEMMREYAEVSDELAIFLQQLLPGPFTILLKTKFKFPKPITTTSTIGIRVPHHVFTTTLVKELGAPITATSANISGETPPFSFDQLNKKILSSCLVGIDGGPTNWREASTIIDFTKEKAVIARKGAEHERAAEAVNGYNSSDSPRGHIPLSPSPPKPPARL